MMTIAGLLGIDVPEVDMVELDEIEGLPEDINRYGTTAYAIRRLDSSDVGADPYRGFRADLPRLSRGQYDDASYRNILAALAIETVQESIDQCVRRPTFSVLIGTATCISRTGR